MTPEFDCQDCGSRVFLFEDDKLPEPPRCSICDFLQTVPEEDREKAATLVFQPFPKELAAWLQHRDSV
jgi:hypothetical protein